MLVSNLSSIGFEFANDADFQQVMQRLATDAFQRLACDVGDYAIWRSRTSAEVWFHITGERNAAGVLADRDVIGLTPFFEGLSDVPVEIVETVVRPGDNDFEGGFLAWVNPDEQTGLGMYQIVFDAVDFAAQCGRPLPMVTRVKLTGFARQIKVLGELDQSRGLARTHGVMALGLFSAREHDAAPSSHALLAGRVVDHSQPVNEESGQRFHWLLVETAGATFDVVADPSLVPTDLGPGCMVEIGCWLFGRLLL